MALPGQKPLNFISSIPKNKSTNVSTSLKTITLLFDKNVVDDSVWDNNRKQIKMWAGPFRISVRISRSKLFSERRKIFVTPIKGDFCIIPKAENIGVLVAQKKDFTPHFVELISDYTNNP